MSDFVYDSLTLPVGKLNLIPVPAGKAANYLDGPTEWQLVMQSMYDLRGAIKNGKFLGFQTLGADPVPAGVTNYIWMRSDGTLVFKNGASTLALNAGYSTFFNVGADGAVAFDGTTTVLGLTPAAGVYTLTRDIFPSTMTIAAGVVIFCANWRIFANQSIIGAGSGLCRIHNDGNAAPAAVTGAVVSATATPGGFYGATIAGNNGSSGLSTRTPPPPFSTASAGGAGGAGTATLHDVGATGTTPFLGGGGGGSSTGASGNYGVAGGSTAPLANSVGYSFDTQMTGQINGTGTQYSFGSGGGSGSLAANSGTNPNGGGGGAGGGCCCVCAPLIKGVSVSTKGGRGGDGFRGSLDSCGAGGGGGGGGALISIYSTRVDALFSAAGGLGGNPANGTICISGAGGPGTAGWVFAYNMSGDGT